ncbi:unnamed protein product [Thelazia callipaeda]|uniref:Glyco_hydro_38C domain-containing protein n=1 Tax=Thelazia callipaeda TaxID=103827 RepID=A0A0N5D1I5_THECL|nr:unnamed protein product [Thelazia callipaeda]
MLKSVRTILVYNSEAVEKTEIIELLVSDKDIVVTGKNGPVQAQVEPFFDQVKGEFTEDFLVLNTHFCFDPQILSPLSFTYIALRKGSHPTTKLIQILVPVNPSNIPELISKHFHIKTVENDEYSLRTARISVKLNSKNGLLEVILLNFDLHKAGSESINSVNSSSTEQMKCRQQFEYYKSMSSGAYVMRLHEAKVSIYENYRKKNENRLHMKLYIDMQDLVNKQLTTRFDTDLESDGIEYFTDNNGLQLIKRREYVEEERPESNYYPMSTALVLQDKSKRLSILSDTPHGVRKFNKISFEIMLDRHLVEDDGKGLGFADDGIPTDNLPVNMEFTFVLEELSPNKKQVCITELRSSVYQVTFTIDSIDRSKRELLVNPVSPFSSPTSFPCDVQLISLRPLASKMNLRLMILYKAGLDCSTSHYPACSADELHVTFSEYLLFWFGHSCEKGVKSYLESIGASSIQKTMLNGVEKIGKEMHYVNETFNLKPMEFAAYLIKFNSLL